MNLKIDEKMLKKQENGEFLKYFKAKNANTDWFFINQWIWILEKKLNFDYFKQNLACVI